MTGTMQTTVAQVQLSGVELELHAGRGAYLPRENTLLVADLHLGKEATFRRHGIPVPSGSTDGTLAAVSKMLEHTGARRLIILGDLFHARSSLSSDTCQSVESFLQRHAGVEVVLVSGNHDRHVGALPPSWPIDLAGDVLTLPGIVLVHEPEAVGPAGDLVICGHIHPAVRMYSSTESLGSLPCFWLSGRQLVLPAIGEFTGTYQVKPRGSDRVWLIADGSISEM